MEKVPEGFGLFYNTCYCVDCYRVFAFARKSRTLWVYS